MRIAIEQFPKQFIWEPIIENADKFWQRENIILCGMGGSHLAADIIKSCKPELKMRIWSDYSLPAISEIEKDNTLVVISSYSGNTEEILHGYATAQKYKIPVLAVSIGGKLLDLAMRDKTPFIKMPDTGIQPRMALGFGVKALLKTFGEERELENISRLSATLPLETFEFAGKKLAERLKNKIPIIYASRRNSAAAKIWKIKFNEGCKIPAFYNIFPELNHNEMTGYDAVSATKPLSEKFHFIFLKDADDYPAILKRMEITEDVFGKRGFAVESVWMQKSDHFHALFSSVFLADWTVLYLAESYNVDSEEVRLIEEFKQKIAK